MKPSRRSSSPFGELALFGGLFACLGAVPACSDSTATQNMPPDDVVAQDVPRNDTATPDTTAADVVAQDLAPPPDVATDTATDVTATDVTATDAATDVSATDAATDVTAPMDAPAIDASADVSAPPDVPSIDAAIDAGGPDVAADVPFRCTSAAQCATDPAGAACDVISGRCVACVAASDTCPAAQHCDDATHRCVAGCSATHGCATGQTCCASACVDTRTSVSHCGACGAICTAAHATPACASSACGVGVCAAGFGDCDGAAANGCEVDLSASTAHCGVCGTACSAAAPTCVMGRCVPDAMPAETHNLSTDSLTPGRKCAEALSMGVTALTPTTVTVSADVPAGCLAAGDLVLLINAQGAPGASVNVGNYEVLTVASVAGATVTVRTAHVRAYGSAAGSDANIGAGDGQQRVVLQRIPVFGDLTVRSGGALTVDAWDGSRGGVLALRASRLQLEGRLNAAGRGYRNGAYSVDDGSCSDSIPTERGESTEGPPAVSLTASVGASGGLEGSGPSFNSNTPLQPSAGHATAGQEGTNPVGRTLGAAGGTYGVADGSRLTMGSGAGGNITCRGGSFGPFLGERSSIAGGIVLVWADEITVEASGSIDASGVDGSRTAGSGGYVMLRASRMILGEGLVRARGSEGTSNTSGGVVTNRGGDGYVALVYRTSLAGTSVPAASVRMTADPFAP